MSLCSGLLIDQFERKICFVTRQRPQCAVPEVMVNDAEISDRQPAGPERKEDALATPPID